MSRALEITTGEFVTALRERLGAVAYNPQDKTKGRADRLREARDPELDLVRVEAGTHKDSVWGSAVTVKRESWGDVKVVVRLRYVSEIDKCLRIDADLPAGRSSSLTDGLAAVAEVRKFLDHPLRQAIASCLEFFVSRHTLTPESP